MLDKILLALFAFLVGALIYLHTLSDYLIEELVKTQKEVETVGFKRENKIKKEVADEKISNILDSNFTIVDGNYSM